MSMRITRVRRSLIDLLELKLTGGASKPFCFLVYSPTGNLSAPDVGRYYLGQLHIQRGTFHDGFGYLQNMPAAAGSGKHTVSRYW